MNATKTNNMPHMADTIAETGGMMKNIKLIAVNTIRSATSKIASAITKAKNGIVSTINDSTFATLYIGREEVNMKNSAMRILSIAKFCLSFPSKKGIK
jgi:hypothetical protein